MKEALKNIAKTTKTTFSGLTNIGIRRMAYMIAFFISLIAYFITGNETVSLIADFCFILVVISVFSHCTCGAKMFKKDTEPQTQQDSEDFEGFALEELRDAFNDIIMEKINSDNFNKDVVDVLEETRDRILSIKEPVIEETPSSGKKPNLKQLMNMINPKKKKDKPKKDNDKTADEIVAEVEEMFNGTPQERTVEEIFDTTIKEDSTNEESNS